MHFLVRKFIPKGSILLMITTFGSYGMGLIRDKILANSFGASVEMDAYNAAFLPSDFIFNVLVASGIAAAVVPLFIELKKVSRKRAYGYINTVITVSSVTMLAMSLGMLLAAPWISYAVAPGLGVEDRSLLVHLMRIVAFSPILFAISNALGAMLVAQKRFFWYGISPIVYNVGIIAGALWLAPSLGIIGVAYGALGGALLHLFSRVIDGWLAGWRPKFTWQWRTKEIRTTVRLMLPKMIGHPVELLTFWIFTSLASLLAVGSITVLNYARNFQSVPVSLLGIAMATAVFPLLAEAALQSAREVKKLFVRMTIVIALTSGAAACLLFLIRGSLVAWLLGGGRFDAAAQDATVLVLGVFCLSIPTESLSHLFARAFYATKDTVTPVIFSVGSLVISAAGAYLLLPVIGITALPAAFFVGSAIKAGGLYWLFIRRL